MNVAQTFVGNVGVYLRCDDIFVTKKFLNGAEIYALSKEVRSIGVPKGMGSGKERNACLKGIFFDDSFNGARGKAIFFLPPASIVNKQCFLVVTARFEVLFEPF